jgi:hypothetical protein
MNWQDDFFVGWSGRLPNASRGVVRALVASIVAIFLLTGLLRARTTDDPGAAGFDWAAGEQIFQGTATAHPYPLLHLDTGHTLLLAGQGKSGIDLDPAFDGRRVEMKGIIIRRGALEMLMTGDDPKPIDAPAHPITTTPLGTWRITGEICDGKCQAGAMQPGRGIAHRACANLCLIGAVPPVYVATGAVEGSEFMLLADPQGRALPDSARNLTALRLQLDGVLERRGDLLVFKTDLAAAKLP